jgi:hypothetical protein
MNLMDLLVLSQAKYFHVRLLRYITGKVVYN